MDSVADKFSAMASNIKHMKSRGSDKIADPQAVSKWSEVRMSVQSTGVRQNKCGWLRKQGGMVKSWHRRWFVLNGDYLFYFQKEDDVRPLGMIYLPGNKIFSHPANPEDPEKFLLELMPEEKGLTKYKRSQGKTQPPTKMAPNHETFLLSASSDDERQDWIKAIRKTMFADKGGAIFGTSLDETMIFERSRSERKVPYIVESCIEFLIRNGLETEGLFRLPGRMLLIRDLKDRFDEGESVDLDIEEIDVHSVASLLKQFLRELPECLIPYKSYQEFMNIAMRFQGTRNSVNKLEEVDILRSALATLPQDNYNVLKYLCHFLHQVSDKTSINKMTVQNLARVFGPNVIRHPQMDDNPEVFMLTTADICEQLAYMLINYDDKIFTIEFDSGRKSANVAVDDLLRMDSISSENDLMRPMTDRQDSAMSDLSNIIIDMRADRRGRSFDANHLPNVPKGNDLHLDMPTVQRDMSNVTSPRSAGTQPVPLPRQSLVSQDGKPIPPIRKKNLRRPQHANVNHTQSNDSISSDNSENNSMENSMEYVPGEYSNQRNSLRNSLTSPINEPNTQMLELQQKLETKTAEFNTLQMKYDNLMASKIKADAHVKNLNDERRKIQERYENHIESLETRHKSQLNEVCAKLEEERCSRAEAVQKIMDLQKTIHNYHMHYGDIKDKLPPLYQK